MQVSLCLHSNSLNVHAKPEKSRTFWDTAGIEICLQKVKLDFFLHAFHSCKEL